MSLFFDLMGQSITSEVTLGHVAAALFVLLASILLRRAISRALLRALLSLASRTETTLDDFVLRALRGPIEAAIVLLGVALGLALVPLPHEPIPLHRIAHHGMVIASAFVGAWVLFRVIDGLTAYLDQISQQTHSKLDHALVPMLRKLVKLFVGVLVFVVAIQNLGYSVSGLLAGLGIGGLAMALAAKDTLASIFAAITLLVDRPFKVGDWVRSPDFEGIVEEIGFRSTRIRTFDRTLTVVPNNRLMDAVIDNQQAMTARRIVLTLALAPATPAALLRQALEEVRRIVAGVEGLSAADQTVRLQNLTPTSVDILVRAFTPATDDATHGAIRQELLLRIVEALERLEVQFAAPAPAPAPPQAATRRS